MGEEAKSIGQAEKEQALKLKDEGNALFKKGEHLKAAGIYAKATKVDPTNHVLFSNLAAALLGTGHKFKQALAASDKAIALKPDFPKSHFRRGQALMGLTREEEAIECFHRTAELDPSNTLVAPKLAECGKLVEAKAFGKTPEGIALAKAGDPFPPSPRALGRSGLVGPYRDLIYRPLVFFLAQIGPLPTRTHPRRPPRRRQPSSRRRPRP